MQQPRVEPDSPLCAEAGEGRPAPQSGSGRWLLGSWAAVSLLYVLVIGVISIGTIQSAADRARHPQVRPVLRAEAVTGPIPDGPPGPAAAIGEAIAMQAALALGPPFLVLWFGWDVWFAVTGLLQTHADTPFEEKEGGRQS